MLLYNVDSDVVAVPKNKAANAPFLGDEIDGKTGKVIGKFPVQAEWESPWMKYTPLGELTEMTRKTFKVTASQDQSNNVAGEHIKLPETDKYPETMEKFSNIVCKTLDLAAFLGQYQNNHALNIKRNVVVAVYATRRVEGGFRIIAYLPAMLYFRSQNVSQVQQSHTHPNLDLRLRNDIDWKKAELVDASKSIEQAVARKRISTVTVHSLPFRQLEHLQQIAECALEIFSFKK